MKKRLGSSKVVFFLILAMLLQIITPLAEINVQASSHDDIIKSLNLSKDRLTSKSESFAIEGRWEISKDGSAKKGDTFTLSLPDDFDLSLLRGRLPLLGSDGRLYGEGSIDKGNKSITFTFSDEVEKRNNVWGEFKIDGIMIDLKNPDPDKGISKEDYEITSSLGSSYKVPIEVNHGLYSDVDKETSGSSPAEPHKKNNFDKIGQVHKGEQNTMYWYVYVNAKEASERLSHELFVEDILGPGHTITESDFSITLTDSANDNESGTVLKEGTDEFNKYISEFKMQEDRKGYSFKFNPIADGDQPKALRIYYHTVIDEDAPFDQTIFENHFNLNSSNGSKAGVPAEVEYGNMRGTGYGIENRTGEFKLFKVDEDGQPIKQEGIKFKLEVTKDKGHYYNKDMDPITIVTNKKGEVIFDEIYSGYYTVTEIVAPDGYILSDKPQNILLNFSELDTTKEALDVSNKELKDLLKRKNLEKDLENNPALKKWYDELIADKKESISKNEKKLEKLLRQGINFKFKNEKIETMDLSTKKRWIGSPESEDIKSEIYLLRKYIKYNEDDSFQIIEEEVPNSRREVSYSKEDQVIEWKNLPVTDQYETEYEYFIVEEESEDFEMTHILEDGQLVIINNLPGEDPEGPVEEEKPEEPTKEEPEEPEEKEKPEEPTKEEPEEEEEGEKPTKPILEEKPKDPEEQEEEEKPEEPTKEEPEEPEEEEKPEEPTKENPEEPEEEEKPEEPTKEDPKEPVEEEKPEEPIKEEPKKPEEAKKNSIKIERVPKDKEEIIKVELIKDGEVVSEKPFILDESNNWSVDFEGLDSGVLSDYSIKAVTSDGKELKVESGVKGFMIVEEEPDFVVANKNDKQSDGPIDLLPQTGELPYTNLYLAGLGLIILGLIIRKKRFK